jgi:glycosyltransferase involved in cell wall biosynthesis
MTDDTTILPADVRARVFVVIAAYNEQASIEQVVRELRAAYPNVVVVDDGSADWTSEAARRVAPFVLRHLLNRGQGAALQTGIDFALARGAEYIVTFDADGQHRVEDIAALIEPIRQGRCDISLGSRFLGGAENMPATRRLTLRGAVWFTRLVNRVRVTDAHNGLRAFSRRAACKLNITLDGMAHASELIDQIRQSGLPMREVPVKVRYTAYSLAKGQSSRGAAHIVVQYVLGRILR